MRSLRRWLSIGLPVMGMVVVLIAIVSVVDRQMQLVFVVAGVLLIEAGVWKLANPILPSERRYTELRGEVDHFVDLVREMNAAAVEARQSDSDDRWDDYQDLLSTLHESVDRMGQLAGKEVGERETAPPPRAVEESDREFVAAYSRRVAPPIV